MHFCCNGGHKDPQLCESPKKRFSHKLWNFLGEYPVFGPSKGGPQKMSWGSLEVSRYGGLASGAWFFWKVVAHLMYSFSLENSGSLKWYSDTKLNVFGSASNLSDFEVPQIMQREKIKKQDLSLKCSAWKSFVLVQSPLFLLNFDMYLPLNWHQH